MGGQDIVVSWESSIGLRTNVLSQPQAWIGLFNAGECSSEDEWRNECYVAYQFLEVGISTGTVRFSQDNYKNAGDFDVRFFNGDTRNGQGKVCRGLTASPGSDNGWQHLRNHRDGSRETPCTVP